MVPFATCFVCDERTSRAGEYLLAQMIKRNGCYDEGNQMSSSYASFGNREKLGHLAMQRPGSNLPTRCTISGAHLRTCTSVEHVVMPLKIVLITIKFKLVNALKLVERQDKVDEVC